MQYMFQGDQSAQELASGQSSESSFNPTMEASRIGADAVGNTSQRAAWNDKQRKYLLTLLFNSRPAKGGKRSKDVWEEITREMNAKFLEVGNTLTIQQIKEQDRELRKTWNEIQELLRRPGFKWDDRNCMFEATNECWMNLFQEQEQNRTKYKKYMRNNIPHYALLSNTYEDQHDKDVERSLGAPLNPPYSTSEQVQTTFPVIGSSSWNNYNQADRSVVQFDLLDQNIGSSDQFFSQGQLPFEQDDNNLECSQLMRELSSELNLNNNIISDPTTIQSMIQNRSQPQLAEYSSKPNSNTAIFFDSTIKHSAVQNQSPLQHHDYDLQHIPSIELSGQEHSSELYSNINLKISPSIGLPDQGRPSGLRSNIMAYSDQGQSSGLNSNVMAYSDPTLKQSLVLSKNWQPPPIQSHPQIEVDNSAHHQSIGNLLYVTRQMDNENQLTAQRQDHPHYSKTLPLPSRTTHTMVQPEVSQATPMTHVPSIPQSNFVQQESNSVQARPVVNSTHNFIQEPNQPLVHNNNTFAIPSPMIQDNDIQRSKFQSVLQLNQNSFSRPISSLRDTQKKNHATDTEKRNIQDLLPLGKPDLFSNSQPIHMSISDKPAYLASGSIDNPNKNTMSTSLELKLGNSLVPPSRVPSNQQLHPNYPLREDYSLNPHKSKSSMNNNTHMEDNKSLPTQPNPPVVVTSSQPPIKKDCFSDFHDRKPTRKVSGTKRKGRLAAETGFSLKRCLLLYRKLPGFAKGDLDHVIEIFRDGHCREAFVALNEEERKIWLQIRIGKRK